ncbi:hypothetical protein TrLO_g11601 [Triparma laevis f. longispina]|uniref:Uncharacterized protein n=1 Tax=Triparma laevis f. longispina TaxID=1714387 RepID=A0A9W7FAT5_9STRA|nr:hypothetical protein TrLO_g11601 [Triparma laevis f. longispina]
MHTSRPSNPNPPEEVNHGLSLHCGKGCTPCRTVCDLPSNVYAFKRNDVGSRNKAINDPAAYTHCSGTLKNDNDYWPQNAKGPTTYWQNGGQNNCWAPYVCSGQSCTPASIYDGCFDSNGNFRVSNQQDNLGSAVSECGNRAFAKNGDPVSIELPLETRKGVIATQAGGGAIAGAGVLGALLFRRSCAKKRSAGDVNAKVVEIGSV